MSQITVSKKEYTKLKKQAEAYRRLTARVFESVIDGSVKEVVEDFQNTGHYSEEFLGDLEKGLHRSSYGKKHEDKGNKKRLGEAD